MTTGKRLAARAEFHAGLLEQMYQRDVRVVLAVAFLVRLVGHDDVEIRAALVEHHHEVAMRQRNAVLAERIEVERDRRQHRVHLGVAVLCTV